MKNKPIPVFIVGIKNNDQKQTFFAEFIDKKEFDVFTRPARNFTIHNSFSKIKDLIKEAESLDTDLVVICESTHRFSSYYSKEHFLNCIKKANKLNADILAGDVNWLSTFAKTSSDIYWVELFTGTQFLVIFRRFFKTILEAAFEERTDQIVKLPTLSNKSFFIYPFISMVNNTDRIDENNFPSNDKPQPRISKIIQKLTEIILFYKTIDSKISTKLELNQYKDISIPTYIINLKERTDRLKHIKQQFENKLEFDLTIVDACKHKIGNVGLWLSIRKIIQLAIANDDDVIVICEDDHEFTEYYCKNVFFKNVFQAYEYGAGILLGGIAHFENTVQVTNDTFWINMFYCTQFMVVYKSLFQRILDEPYDNLITVDGLMSIITSNKLVMFPFISVQKFLGKSDVTNRNSTEELLEMQFNSTFKRFEKIKYALAINQ